MKINKKKLIFSLGTISSVITPALAASCFGSKVTNPFANSKVITLAVDGVQKKFYDKVQEEFKKTDLAKEGYTIRLVERDVWASLDRIGTVGITDKENPDILYAPQDRVTTFLQSKSVTDLDTFDADLQKDLFTALNLTEAEKKAAVDFGTVQFIGDKGVASSGYFAIPHNKEGLILVSNKSQNEMKSELSAPTTDTLKELVESGKGFFRIQDFWYGNGVFAGAAGEDMMGKIFYKENGKWTSGFIKDNANHEQFKKGIAAAADLMWPIFNAAYNMDAATFASSVWGSKGISQSDLKALLTNDMGAVNNMVASLLRSGKLDYAMIGTWDVNVAISDWKANGFLNVIKVNEENQYIQAPGSWSFLINARNNGSSAKRRQALKEILKIMLSKEAYFEYFVQDSKVPLYPSIQNGVKELNNAKAAKENKEFNDLITTELGYTTIEEFEKVYNEFLSAIRSLGRKDFDQWLIENNDAAFDESNLLEIEKPALEDTFKEYSEEFKQLYTDANFGKTTGLVNTMAAIMGKKLSEWALIADGNWKISSTNAEFKNNSESAIDASDLTAEEKAEAKDILAIIKLDDNHFHTRKFEKYIFNVNGDNSADKEAKAKEIVAYFKEDENGKKTFDEALYKKEVVDVSIAKAKKLAKYFFTNPIDESNLENIITTYLNAFKAKAIFGDLIEQYIQSSNFPSKAKYDAIVKTENKYNEVLNTEFGGIWEGETFDNIVPSKDKLTGVLSEDKLNEYDALPNSTLGIKNMVAQLFGSDFSTWDPHWQLPVSALKTTEDFPINRVGEGGYSVREVGQFLIGINAENKFGVKEFITGTQTLDEIAEATKAKLDTYSNATLTLEQVKEIIGKHLNSFIKARFLLSELKKSLENPQYTKPAKEVGNPTVIQQYELFLKNKSIDKILQLMTSTKPITNADDDALGEFKSQASRIDRGNPQFGAIWGIWNDQAFGNQKVYADWGNEKLATTKEQFIKLIEDKLDDQMAKKAQVLDKDTASEDHVVFA